ncbi:MAG: peptidoglycan DD-metalloendopeptidase family protein [Candidatus Gracilibacteria bacterium]|nr:peptidoglycan DD-metalloendopeptidase family protein [Candidatus Gracilibacteria bacterium]
MSVFALSSKSKGLVLKNFKKESYKLYFESDKPFLDEKAREIFNSSRKYELYKSIREKIQDKREFLEKENIKVTNKITNLADSVKTLDKEIENIRKETVKINNQIIYLQKTINTKVKTINILKDKITTNKEILYKYIVYLYKKGNYIFKDGEVDNIKVIFYSGEDIGTILNELNFKGMIQIAGKRLIDKHKGYINNLYIEQLSLKKSQIESKKLRKQLIIQKGLVKQKIDFKEKLLTISKGKQQLYQKFIEDKKSDEKKIKIKEFLAAAAFRKNKKELLKNEGCSYINLNEVDIKTLNISDKCMGLNSIINIESQLKGFNSDDAGNILKWPIEAKKGISTFFHDNGYITMFGEDHDALDIPTPQGTDIKAPADGYVVYVAKPTAKGYSFVALKHANGIITVYGHLSKVLVKEMQIIKQGEVFAKSGGAPGVAGSGPMTTGAHLHFEVWDDKKLKDPLQYVNISRLNPKNLSPVYFSKYKLDYKATNGKEYSGVLKSNIEKRTFKVTGDNEIERQKNFLKTYATGPFKNWSLWVEEGINGKIDPTFLMCVGLAETGLGKNLKTPNNVGNVGNTDSGATKYFTSPNQGIAAMTQTFNNKYLSQYDEIRLLSRYGNLDDKKPIYASSPDNWHNNIISCMSFIKGRYISDSYNFRLK